MYKTTESQAFFSVSLETLQKMIEEAVMSAIRNVQPADGQSDENHLLTVNEAANLLKVSPISVYRYAKHLGLPHIKGRKNLLFRKSDVLAWVNKEFAQGGTIPRITDQLKKKGGK